jgi:VanZ family protein
MEWSKASCMKTARVTAVVLVLLLFTVGSLPETGSAFPGAMHWIAHLGMYALLAFVIGLGWRHWPAYGVVVLVALIGVAHEASEIITHHHALEIWDVGVNALGALAGTFMQWLAIRYSIRAG